MFLQESFQLLRRAYPGPRLLIVSNSAGSGRDPNGYEADMLERNTGVKVFRHSTKKPGCGIDVLNYFCGIPETGVKRASDIVIVGDRLFTDIMMANLMGAWSIWIKDGIEEQNNMVSDLDLDSRRKTRSDDVVLVTAVFANGESVTVVP